MDNSRCDLEFLRLQSYVGWPVTFISPETLAGAGFYYTQDNDRVRCPFCGIEISRWDQHDDPREEHAKRSPTCRFVLDHPCGNVPIGGEHRSSTSSVWPDTECIRQTLTPTERYLSYDTQFREPTRRFVLNRPSSNVPIGELRSSTSNVWINTKSVRSAPIPIQRYSSYGIQFREGKEEECQSLTLAVCEKVKPVYPAFADKTKRFNTFKKWPVALKTRPRALCEAGFYYTGTGDETKCFQCGVGVCCWEDDDDPWICHARYSPKCVYVRTVKGLTEVSSTTTSLNADTKELSETNTIGKELENATELCKLCSLTERTTVLLPCAHLVSCVTCATKLTSCPVCRGDIKATLRVFLVN